MKSDETLFSSVEFKKINNNKTCHIKPLDQGLERHASVVTPIGIITCGGKTIYGYYGYRNESARLTNRNTWGAFPSMNEARVDHHMVVVGDTLVAIDTFWGKYEKINWRNGNKWESFKMKRYFICTCVTIWDEENVLITGTLTHVSNTTIDLFEISSFKNLTNIV